MKRLAILLLLLALVPAAHAQSYSAQLSGAAEFPGPGDSDGSGFAVVTITGTTLRYAVWTQSIATPILAHIHAGNAGASGPPVVDLDVNSLGTGTRTISQQLANEISANPSGYYVNVHTSEFPNGAVRGQLARGEGEGVLSGFFPIIGRVKGAFDSNFVTDMSIVNAGGATASVNLEFFSRNANGQAGPSTTRTVTVAPGEQKVLGDVMANTLSLADGLGALRVTSDQNVRVNARIINDLRSSGRGTAGFAYESRAAGSTSGSMPFLQEDASYRTNIGYFNPTTATVTATFVAKRTSDGAVLGRNTVTIPGYAMDQAGAFSLISSVPEASRQPGNFYVTWTSSGPLSVYASVTDKTTNDAVLTQ